MIESINPAELQTALFTIGTFLAIGAGTNYAQYQKKVEDTPEKWRFDKALPALGKGALAGAVAYFLGLPPEVTAIAGVLGGLLPIYEQVHHGSLTFGEVFSIARKGGDSPAASATRGAEAAYEGMDTSRVREGVEDIRRTAAEHDDSYGDPEAVAEGVEDEERRQFLGLGTPTSETGRDEVVTDGP